MNRILVFQHVGHEILGTLHPLLKRAGFRIKYANFGRHPDLRVSTDGYDGLVVLGGPMGVYETAAFPHLAHEMDCIRSFIAQDKPILGICLGAQLIAATLGATVSCAEEREIGWYDVALTDAGRDDPVLGVMQPVEKIFQWHGDFFQVPEGAVWLAKSSTCPFQAFRWGRHVYGFQFHLEVDDSMIERWLSLPEHAPYFLGEVGQAKMQLIREETKQQIAASKALSNRVFLGYINMCNAKSRLRHKATPFV